MDGSGSVVFARWRQCAPHIESQKRLPWQRPLESQNCLCLHRTASPRKPTPRIKQRVISYHTTEVIAHQKPSSGCHSNVQSIGNTYILSANHSNPPSITNCLVAINHTKPAKSNFSPKIGCHCNDP